MSAPEKLRVPYEDFEYGRFQGVGRLQDGTQFMSFVTGAFPSGQEYYGGKDWREKKRWLAVIHRFDAEGNHIGSESRVGGVDAKGQAATDRAYEYASDLWRDLLHAGSATFCDVWVKPFSVELDGVTHGLIYEHYVEQHEGKDEEFEYVMLQPQDIMFHPPWDSGEYST